MCLGQGKSLFRSKRGELFEIALHLYVSIAHDYILSGAVFSQRLEIYNLSNEGYTKSVFRDGIMIRSLAIN